MEKMINAIFGAIEYFYIFLTIVPTFIFFMLEEIRSRIEIRKYRKMMKKDAERGKDYSDLYFGIYYYKKLYRKLTFNSIMKEPIIYMERLRSRVMLFV